MNVFVFDIEMKIIHSLDEYDLNETLNCNGFICFATHETL